MGGPDESFGVFSEPVGLAVGDPFKQEKAAKGCWGGKQFSTSGNKTGKTPDAYIDKQVRSLAEGDRYVDTWILDKRLSRLPGQPVSNKPFYRRAAVHPSASCGPGSNDGCLSPVPLDTDGSAAALRSKHPRGSADKLRNIYTSAPKKGGYGMPWQDMTLGEPPKYYIDVYNGGREKEKELCAHERPVSTKPFISMGHPGRPFTPDPELYSRPAPAGATSSSSSSMPGTRPVSSKRASSAPRERPQSAPWRPSSPSKQGAAFCVLSHTGRNYVPDPVREAKFHAKEHAAVRPFRPTSGSKARLSMWSPNPFATAPRPAPDIDFTLS